MVIYLGKELGSGAWLPFGPKKALAGVEVLGPSGFLNFLEVHSGCSRKGDNPVLRVARFERSLHDCAKGVDRFYSASFKLDSFGVAQRLLTLRDNILLGAPESFTFRNFKSFKTARIRDIAEVSCHAEKEGMSPGEPDRIRNLIHIRCPDNGQGGFSAIPDRLLLREPWDSWPRLWTELFDCLAGEGTEIEEFNFESACQSMPPGQVPSDLGSVQEAIGRPDRLRSIDLRKDGSVIHVRAAGLFECADLTAGIIAGLGPDSSSLVIIPPNDTSLDEGLVRQGMPRAGHMAAPSVPALLRFLFSGLTMLWKPVNPEEMRQFLLIRPSPLHSGICRDMLKYMSGKPGCGGPGWLAAVNASFERHLSGFPSEEQTKHRLAVNLWLLHRPYPGNAGVPAAEISERCCAYSAWAQVQEEIHERGGLFKTCRDQADTFAQILGTCGRLQYSLQEIRQICDMLSRGISPVESAPREISGVSSVSSASAVLRPVDNLIWYNAAVSTIGLGQPDPLSRSENHTLEKYGYRRAGTCSSPEELMAQEQSWQTAVRMAAKRLVLISPFSNGGEPQEPHPIWHEIIACFKDGSRARAALEKTFAPDLLWAREGIASALGTFPAKDGRRGPDSWQVTDSYIPREKESPTSLMSLIECPMKYTFQRSAGISKDDTPTLPAGQLLAGYISHHVLQTFMLCWERFTKPAEISRQVDKIFTSYINSDINIINLPGRDSEREMLRHQLITAARRLVTIMEANGFGTVSKTDIEAQFMADTEIGCVGGYCDLILRKRNHPEDFFIVDFKTSRKRYHNLVKNGCAVQLASYSRIARSQKGEWPPTGYLVVSSGELVTCHGSDVIKEAYSYPAAPKEEETWDAAVVEARKVKHQLESGIINYGDDWKDDPEFIPAGCDYCEYRDLCGIKIRTRGAPPNE